MTLSPCDVVLIPFPYTDLKTAKRRPVLVLRASDEYGDFLAVAITSKPHHSFSIPLSSADFTAGSLPKASWVRSDKLYTLNAASVLFVCGRLTPTAFAGIQTELCRHLGC